MKKIFVGCAILALGAMQLPAFCGSPYIDTWSALKTQVQDGDFGTILQADVNIIAPGGAGSITNSSSHKDTGLSFGPSNNPQYIQGDGVNYVFVNEGTMEIDGSGADINTINSYDTSIQGNTPSIAAIQNNGQLMLMWVGVNGGISQSSSSATLWVENTGPVTLSGSTNSITGGTINFYNGTPPQGGNLLNIAGGFVTAGVDIQLGQGNTLQVSGTGNVTIDGSDAYQEGIINVTGGTLNFDAITWNTGNSSTAQFRQSGGTTNFNNGSSLTLASLGSSISGGNLILADASSLTIGSNGSSSGSITGGNVSLTGGSSMTVENGLSSNAAAVTMASGSLIVKADASGTASTLTLNSGSLIQGSSILNIGVLNSNNYSNTVNVATGATIEKSAQVNLYNAPSWNNNLNITGGNVTLDSADILGGNLNLTSGSLTLDGISYNNPQNPSNTYHQTGGTLNLINGTSFYTEQLNATPVITTNGSGSGTTIVNIGATSGTDTSSFTLGNAIVLAPAAAGDTLTVNVGNGSTGNSLDIAGGTLSSAVTVNLNAGNTINISGGTATLNQAGQGIDTWAGRVNLSGGDLYLDSITSEGALTQTGGNVYYGSSTAGGHLVKGEHHFHGGNIELRNNGALTLAAPDTWTTTNFAVKGGTLTLDNFSHDTTDILTPGTINQTSGTTRLINGSTLSIDDSSHFTGGNLSINDTSVLNLTTANGATLGASLSGNGRINKDGVGALLLSGINSAYTGDLYINSGVVNYNSAQSYISGTTHMASGSSLSLSYSGSGLFNSPVALPIGSTLNLNTNGNNVTSLSNNISGGGTLNVTGGGNGGSGGYTVLAGSNGNLDYNLNVTQGGSMTVTTNPGTAANFSAPVNVNSSTLRTSSGSTNFNNGLALDHGYLGILNNGFSATSSNGILPALTVGSTIDTMNGVVATNNIVGDLKIGTSGTGEFLIDISPATGTSDKYQISGDITKDAILSAATIDISRFSLVGPITPAQHINLNIFNAAGTVDSSIVFKATDSIVTSPFAQYRLASQGNGAYSLNFVDYNPQVFRGQVATEAAYANQLTTNNVIFDHIGLVTQQLLSSEKPNVYANENPLFAPYQYDKQGGNLWYKAYGNLERLQLSQNINTQNNMWGSLIGADFPLVNLKNGWKLLPTAYVGYTGAYQTYNGVDMYQNGGQGGIMGTFYKGNFIESLLANVGGYGNDMYVNGTRDTTGNWFAGVASKSAYNISLPKDFILQPNFLVSYNAFGNQNWNSGFGNTSMLTNMLNGLNVAPGLNLILNKDTWSVYATTQLMFNVMNGVSGSINNIDLPQVKMGTAYFSYGLGFTKRFKDRLSVYGQVLFSNGVRTGVGFQGGLEWKF